MFCLAKQPNLCYNMFLEKERNMELFKKALELYGVDLSSTKVVYANMGKSTAGQAIKSSTGVLQLRFNTQVPQSFLDSDTIPHEVAHLVCYQRPELGKGHDAGWVAVCKALGGTGERTFSGLDLRPVRVNKTWLYSASEGSTVVLSTIRHNKLQRDKVLAYVFKIKGKVTKDNFIQGIV